MKRRDQLRQKSPAPNQDLSQFSSHDFRRGLKIYRAHTQSPWYFTSSPEAGKEHEGGRFDLPAPKGTLYVANNALSTLAEKVGPDLLDTVLPELPDDTFDQLFVSSVKLPYDYRVADLWDQGVTGFGVIASEMSSSAPYAITQKWAAAWRRAQIDGVRYSPRHDPNHSAYSLALFGYAGDASRDNRRWPIPHAVPAKALFHDFAKAFQVNVVNVPSKSQVEFVYGDRNDAGTKARGAPRELANKWGEQHRLRDLVHTLKVRANGRLFRYRIG